MKVYAIRRKTDGLFRGQTYPHWTDDNIRTYNKLSAARRSINHIGECDTSVDIVEFELVETGNVVKGQNA